MAYAPLDPTWWNDLTPNPAHELLLCSYDGQGIPVSCEVQVDVRPIAGLTLFPPRTLSFPGGQDHPLSAKLRGACGFLRFVLTEDVQGGDQNERVLYSDLTSGRFAIGTQVKVDVYASLWGGTAGISCEAQAWVGPTSDGCADWLPYTIPLIGLTAGEVIAGVRIPPCARYVDLQGLNGTIGSTTTAMKFRTSNRVLLNRDYQTPSLTPGWTPEPIPSFGTTALETITVTNDSTATGDGSLLFWVRG